MRSNHSMQPMTPDRAVAGERCFVKHAIDQWSHPKAPQWAPLSVPEVSEQRRARSLSEVVEDKEKDTFLYLAYGSNLCDETFLGKRGIRPLASINVQVPDLRMTFDLPGIPYAEPCFANSARRDPGKEDYKPDPSQTPSEKAPLTSEEAVAEDNEYQKDKWKKGLVGVVYEVTPKDYAHIIATEGGGFSYKDILIDCYPLDSDPLKSVPWHPATAKFRAHTLFAPAVPDNKDPSTGGGRVRRPDPSYAQASARYLKLITDGAKERKLPYEYQDFLHSLQPYTITSQRQRLGQFIFMTLWTPFIFFVFGLQRQYDNDKGEAPAWLQLLASAIFRACWDSYDNFFKDLFGEGERTSNEKDEESTGSRRIGKYGLVGNVDQKRNSDSSHGLLEDKDAI